MRSVLPVFFATSLAVQAQLDSELAPRELERSTEESELPFGARDEAGAAGVGDDSAVLIDELWNIILHAEGEASGAGIWREAIQTGPRSATLSAEGLTVEKDELAALFQPFFGRALSEDGLDRLIDALLSYYESHDRPVTDIYAPAQELAGGTIRLEIIEGTVGAIGIEAGDFFNDELLGKAVQLQQGEILTTSALQTHLDWYNRNPFRPAALYAAPGEGEGEADVIFAFTESRPWRVYAGYENSGSEAAGENRYLGGFNWGNAFGLDHILSYQFTMGDSYDELHAHSASWEIPIHPWHHFVRLSGTWAGISSDISTLGNVVNSSGTSWQIGAAYGLQLPRWKEFKQEITFGGEFKFSDNFLVFGDDDAHPGSEVEIVQFRTDYRATGRHKSGALDVQGSLVASPGGLSGKNDDADFETFRTGADATYLYARGRALWLQQLPKEWTLRVRGQVQVASGALLPTEQLALGGHTTIRGYEERDYLADHGYALSAELRSPAFDLPTGKLPDSQVQFLGFLDHGVGWREEVQAGEDESELFLGAGLGARLQIGSNASLRADVGLPLTDGEGARGHVGVTVTF